MSSQEAEKYYRHCPGEERMPISDAVCSGRRRANFAKCKECQFNSDRRGQVDIAEAVQHRAGIEEQREMSDDKISKVFKAYDVRAKYPDPLDEEIAWRVGYATSQFLRSQLSGVDRADRKANTLVIGRDMRLSSPSLQKACIEGALSTGSDVIDIGQIDTSQIYFAINYLSTCGGIQTTASHNPAKYNGLKVAGQKGRAVGQDTGLEEIRRLAVSVPRHESSLKGELRQQDLAEPYKQFVRKFLKKTRPMKVVVDASNGMAGKWFPHPLRRRAGPADHPAELRHARQGRQVRPRAEPPDRRQPQAAPAGRSARSAPTSARASTATPTGASSSTKPARSCACDFMTALLGRALPQGKPRRDRRIRPAQRLGRQGRDRKGRRRAQAAARRARLHEAGPARSPTASSAASSSGHFYFRDNWHCDSGMLAFVAVLNLLSSEKDPLSKLIAPLARYATSGEQNYFNEDKDGTIQKLMDKYKDGEVDTLDGVTVQYPDWWFNVRKSNTEPLLRLNLEAKTEEIMQQKLAELTPLLGKPDVQH